jgi:hypothetical protein
MTDLHSQIVDARVGTHCDCMFMVNTHRWDYAKVAALIAPRPLLISNSDKDQIFPFEGIVRFHSDIRSIYQLYGAADKLGLLITEGLHKDTQDLQVPAFRWFNRFLKRTEPLISVAAEKLFSPQQLKVFSTLPEDERTTSIHETFVPAAAPRIPANKAEWERLKQEWLQALCEKSFAGWPAEDARESLALTRIAREARGNLVVSHWEFRSQGPFRLPLFVLSRGDLRDARRIRLHVLDEQGWASLLAALGEGWRSRLNLHPATVASSAATVADHQALLSQVERGDLALAYLAPRGVGPSAWSGDERQHIQIRRRFMLLGQTLDGMRVWDIRRAVEALRHTGLLGSANIELKMAGERNQAVNALYASLFSDGLASLELIEPPTSHQTGPDYLNVLRFLDIPQAVAMAAERHPIKLTRSNVNDWAWAAETARRLGWAGDRLK